MKIDLMNMIRKFAKQSSQWWQELTLQNEPPAYQEEAPRVKGRRCSDDGPPRIYLNGILLSEGIESDYVRVGNECLRFNFNVDPDSLVQVLWRNGGERKKIVVTTKTRTGTLVHLNENVAA